MASPLAVNGVKLATASLAYVDTKAANNTKALMAELSRQFYGLRLVSRPAGSIAIKVHDHSIPKGQHTVALSHSGENFSIFLFLIQFFCSLGMWFSFSLFGVELFWFKVIPSDSDFLAVCNWRMNMARRRCNSN